MAAVVERYKVPGADLAALGYEVAEPQAVYWFMRRWDAEHETWFVPQPVSDRRGAVVDTARSVRHGLGFVPIVWIRNLPGGIEPDGACTFRAAIESSIEIDYQLSQAGRGLKYSSDPTLLIKEPAGLEGDIVRGAGNALVVSEKGDARLLEIGGTAAGGGARLCAVAAGAGAGRGARQPGRRQPAECSGVGPGAGDDEPGAGLVGGQPAGQLRRGRVAAAVPDDPAGGGTVSGDGRRVRRSAALDAGAPLRLVWPPWYPSGSEDRARDAATLLRLAEAEKISPEVVRRWLEAEWGGLEDRA